MTYLGQDAVTEELTMEHAVTKGVHDAISTTISYTVLLSVAVLALTMIAGPAKLGRIINRIGG